MELLLASLVLVAACLTTASAVECYRPDQNNYCRCTITSSKTKKNITIDLEHIGLSYPLSLETTDGKYIYRYTPCKAERCPGTTSGDPGALCQEIKSQNRWVSTGRFKNFKWNIITDDPAKLNFTITYAGGDEDSQEKKNRKSNVIFTWTSSDTKFAVESQSGITYLFTVQGKGVKPYKPQSSGGGSGKKDISGPIGLTIICLAIAGLVAYCILGGVYMYRVKGARGSEVIPNAGFWRALPGLIKDGFLFTISPCRKRGDYQSL